MRFPSKPRSGPVLGGLLFGSLLAAGCDRGVESTRGPEAGDGTSREASEQASRTDPTTAAAESPRGFFLRKGEASRLTFVPWKSELAANRAFAFLKGGEDVDVRFVPGTYRLSQALELNDVERLRISGTSGVTFEFADGPDVVPRTTEAIADGATTIRVDRPEELVAGWNYQLYPPNKRGDRLLEFRVESVEGDVATLARPARYMPHVKEIPAGCPVYEEVNVFRIRKCPGIVIEDLVLDGRGRGDVRGHTIYTGIYATGEHHPGEPPRTSGLTVRGCTFRGFSGRGVVFYSYGEALVENCAFHDIRAEAIEIDHFSSGRIAHNFVQGAQVGVQLNDAFDSLVEGNVLRDCDVGVYFLKGFQEDWVNTKNVVRDNLIGPGCVSGIAFRDAMAGNVILGNHFVGLASEQAVVNGDGNSVGPR